VDKHSTRAPTKDTEKRMVFHMSCDTTQHRASETTYCVGWLMKCQQTNHGCERSLHSPRRIVSFAIPFNSLDLRRWAHKEPDAPAACHYFSDPPLRADLHCACACFYMTVNLDLAAEASRISDRPPPTE
jgi:hypothetical protein